MERLEEFTLKNKNFMYADFSFIKENNEFVELIKKAETKILSYPENTLLIIINIGSIKFPVLFIPEIEKFIMHITLFQKNTVVIGIDGVKKMLISSIAALSERKNLHFAFTKEKAIEWLLQS
jgi:acyl CoA:acetate/3-ketoacid CoA transferase alpha subunit